MLELLLVSFSKNGNDRRRRVMQGDLEKKNISKGLKKKGTEENKQRYIRTVLFSDIVGMKV